MILVILLIFVGISVLLLFYKDFKTIEKLTREIGELTADNELLQIDLEGQKLFTKVYESFLESCHLRERDLMDELDTLQHKNVKSKKVVKKDKIKTETKTKK